ncbi:large-conductance mechanosensitive channel protein MscL [Pectinatus sottacetonis]|uniref:large-conductance mechanosensitive channel protein MscL n=1 Tax=Pectinatus sottacetonis TaxID=1002795 RepID=UPI0018C685CF|nr:large-conductance mechanosensitive channel protein MscL [Pectinatus sottacetonis]
MKKFIAEFKSFAMRGNVIDLAVGVIVGSAFGKIVSSLVTNIIMPPIGLLLGGVKFSSFFINLGDKHVTTLEEAQAANVPVIAYGAFLDTVIEFFIISLAVFVVVKQVNKLKPKSESLPKPRLCPYCKQPIADNAVRCPHCTSMLTEK